MVATVMQVFNGIKYSEGIDDAIYHDSREEEEKFEELHGRLKRCHARV